MAPFYFYKKKQNGVVATATTPFSLFKDRKWRRFFCGNVLPDLCSEPGSGCRDAVRIIESEMSFWRRKKIRKKKSFQSIVAYRTTQSSIHLRTYIYRAYRNIRLHYNICLSLESYGVNHVHWELTYYLFTLNPPMVV